MSKQLSRKTLLKLSAAIAAGALALRFLGPVLLPFALGLLPAKIADKAADRLQSRLHGHRTAAAAVCVGLFYLLFFLTLWLLGSILLRELESFFRALPTLAGSLAEPVARLKQQLLRLAARFPDGIGAALEQGILDFFRNGAGLGSKLYDRAFSLASGLLRKAPDIALFSLTALLSGFFLAAELPQLRRRWEQKLPARWKETWQLVCQKLKGTLFCWLKAQGMLMLVTFLVLTAGFLILGIDYPLLFGCAIALIDALPVLGSGLVLIPWSLVQFLAGNTFWGVGLLCIYGTAALLRTALEPKLLGRQMGLDPLLTLLALYAGYRFFGIWGMILFPMGAMFCKQILKTN